MFELIPRQPERTRALASQRVDPFTRLHQEFDQVFERVFGSLAPLSDWENNRWGLDVTANDKEVWVRAEAPGFEPGDFDIQVLGDTLQIRAQHQATEQGDGNSSRAWTRNTRLERVVTLPPGTDVDKVEANYRNGVLEIRVPRAPEAVGRKIEVKA